MPSPSGDNTSAPAVSPSSEHQFTWLGSGAQFLEAQLAAIGAASRSVRIEVYIFSDSKIGREFRDALAAAAHRGLEVAILADRFGSAGLPRDFFQPLIAAGGKHLWFNLPRPGGWTVRNHRKVLIVDDQTAFIGGCNVSNEHTGDGITHGWRDGGISVTGPIIETLAGEFRQQWARSQQSTWKLIRGGDRRITSGHAEISALFTKPGVGGNPLRSWLREDLRTASDVAITSAYFLPTRSLRGQLLHARHRGARVRLLLAGRSDVRLLQIATRSLYRKLLKGGIDVFEYEPQILHAKLLVLDDVVYVGSANLDPRSLRINFEIMLRIKNAALAARAREQFETDLLHSRTVTLIYEPGLVAFGRRMLERIACFVFMRFDPWIARDQLRRRLSRSR